MLTYFLAGCVGIAIMTAGSANAADQFGLACNIREIQIGADHTIHISVDLSRSLFCSTTTPDKEAAAKEYVRTHPGSHLLSCADTTGDASFTQGELILIRKTVHPAGVSFTSTQTISRLTGEYRDELDGSLVSAGKCAPEAYTPIPDKLF